MTRQLNILLIFVVLCAPAHCYITPVSTGRRVHRQQHNPVKVCSVENSGDLSATVSRRDVLSVITLSYFAASISPANAVSRESLDELLYRIVRVREATEMESRLIKTGKFKDAQRANIKLAVRFMVDNYRLNDAFLAASTYLDGTSRRLEASQLGQSATQNLITILEYFDASDVQNLKVITATWLSAMIDDNSNLTFSLYVTCRSVKQV